ncbi:MAG: L,D-transpeptidase [Deltaproteobacteria bacterium]|nr:L,D-transpeptidase [Deltaproteobacteria bacterium]
MTVLQRRVSALVGTVMLSAMALPHDVWSQRVQRAVPAPARAAQRATITISSEPLPRTPVGVGAHAVVGTGVRSVRVVRAGEVIRARPDVNSPRRGTAALDAYLPALEAAVGPGCSTRWIRVAPSAWICQAVVETSAHAPTGAVHPVLREGAWLPYDYSFAAHSGVHTFRSQQDALNDDWTEELERSMGVAVTSVQRFGGQRWVQTASARWIAQRDLISARPSEWQGALIDASIPSADRVGFAKRRAFLWPTAQQAVRGGRGASSESVQARELLVAVDVVTLHGQTLWQTPRGWINRTHVHVANGARIPRDLRVGERWVDVDVASQTMVAYEGERPVYVTLTSTGRRGFDTARGEFRAWVKLATTDMSNADDPTLDTATRLYSVERVPWVIFFHNDQALHGVYWHDRFGVQRSHGCINLAPRDARWLFEWAPPELPAGWTAVFPTEEQPGLRVRVR